MKKILYKFFSIDRLWKLAQSGDGKAMGQLQEKYERLAFGLIVRNTNETDDTVLQMINEISTDVWNNRLGIDDPAEFWLERTVTRIKTHLILYPPIEGKPKSKAWLTLQEGLGQELWNKMILENPDFLLEMFEVEEK